MTDTEKAALERRIDELCAENERLRQENQSIGMAAYELGRKSVADENAKLREQLEYALQTSRARLETIDRLKAENAKLRELVGRYDSALMRMCDQTQGFYSQSDLHPCDECELGKGYGFDKCGISELQEGARELGVEVG